MASNNEMIDVVSSETHASIQALIADLRQVSTEITNVNRNLNSSSRPSDNRSNLNTINQQQQQLNTTRQRANQLSAEEIVNQRQLRQNADLLARSNSALAGAYGRLSAQQAIASRNLQNLVARGRSAEQSQRSYNRELRTAQNEFNRLNQRVLSADRAVGRFNRNVGNYPKQAILGIKNLLGAFGLVGGLALIASMTKAVYDQVKAQQSLDLALKQVTGTYDENLRAQQFIKEQAEKNGAEINSLTTAYTKFYVSAKDKISTNEIENIFGSITKAGSTMGLTFENQERAFTALNQMFSKGTVQAEELRTQLGDALPGAIGIMERAFRKTNPELFKSGATFEKLMKDGKILASEVLPEFARELERTYGIDTIDRVENLATAQNRLTNSFKNFIDALNTGQGVIGNFFTRVSTGLSNNIDLLSKLVKSDAQNARDKNASYRLNEYNKELALLESLGKEKRKQRAEEDKAASQAVIDDISGQKNALNKSLGWDPETRKFESDITDDDIKMLRYYNLQIEAERGTIAAANKVLNENTKEKQDNTEATKEQIAEAKRMAEALDKLNEEYLKNSYRLNVMRRESEKGSLEELLENDKDYVSQKLDLESSLTDEELNLSKMKLNEDLRLAKVSYDEQVKNSKGNKDIQKVALKNYLLDQRTAYESFNQGIYETTLRSEKRILDIKEKYLDDYYEYRKKFEGDGLKFEVDPIAEAWFENQEEKALKLIERTKELKNATKEYLDSFSLGFINDAGLGSLTKLFDQTLDPLTGKMQSTFDKLWEGAETTKEKFAVAFTSITEIIQETFNFLNQNQQAYFDAQYSRLEKEKDIAIDFAGDSASAREEIEMQYEERRRQIRRQEAEAQKELAIFNAIINTAQGVVAALANPGGPAGVVLAAAVGVIGAAQIALISQQSVPEYILGTDFHQGGKAIVGDGGKHEIVYQPSSGFSVTPKTDTLVDLERGSKVYPDFNSFLKNSGSMLGGIPNIQLEQSGISYKEMDKIMAKYSKDNQPEAILSKTKILSFVGSAGSRQQSANDRFTYKVKKVN